MSLRVTLMDAVDLEEILACIHEPVAEENIRARVKAPGLNFTARANGLLVACGGVLVFWAGVGEAWFKGTPALSRHPVSLYKAARKWLPETIRLLGLWRVEHIVRAEWIEANRFAQHLGFVAEGTKRQYFPDGGDAVMYAKIIEKGEADG